MLRTLKKARATGGVVCCKPTSIKSFFLKFVESVSRVEELTRAEHVDDSKSGFRRAMDDFAALFRRRPDDSEREKELNELDEQIKLCVEMLGMFRDGVAILDEVDLLLHPLKSELNWPSGIKRPLDFTRSRKGDGLRWKIPFHLLDGIFFATEERVVAFNDSRQAMSILQKLKAAVDEGLKNNFLQIIPHLALIDLNYYRETLKPLLARWILVWLTSKQIQGVEDNDLLEYLIK